MTVTLEFPEKPDSKAETEFIDLLKGIYLEKVKTMTVQEEGHKS